MSVYFYKKKSTRIFVRERERGLHLLACPRVQLDGFLNTVYAIICQLRLGCPYCRATIGADGEQKARTIQLGRSSNKVYTGEQCSSQNNVIFRVIFVAAPA